MSRSLRLKARAWLKINRHYRVKIFSEFIQRSTITTAKIRRLLNDKKTPRHVKGYLWDVLRYRQTTGQL
jgi:hypothetical protein